jgi:thiol-disulfide isomerase/thioredoxin
MTGRSPRSNNSTPEPLKRCFAVWTLAVLGSMAGAATVTLPPGAAWADDDPAAETKPQRSDKPAAPPLDRTQLLQLVQSPKLAEAAEQLDAARQENPDDFQLLSFEYLLASNLSRTNSPAGPERFEKLLKELEGKLADGGPAVSLYSNCIQGYAQMMASRGQAADGLQIVDRGTEGLAQLAAAGSDNPNLPSALAAMRTTRARLLISVGQADEAREILDRELETAMAAAKENPLALANLVSLATAYSSLLQGTHGERVAEVEQQVETLVVAHLDSESAGLPALQAFQNLRLSQANRLTYSDAGKAKELLVDLRERIVAVGEKLSDRERTMLERATASVDSMLERIETALRREQLVGTPAPELDVQQFVAMEPVTMADLKGKVVLLDFWAVWCGPCIATFPHLRHWHEEYAEKGLVIIGVTREYGYAWDDESQRASTKPDVTTEEEMAMLEKFRQHHTLHHGFLVTPKNSDFSKQYTVTGIPQAVVIDQDGVIRMIRVGSGQANADAIENLLKELLP